MLVVLFFATACLASFQDGVLRIGENYNTPLYSPGNHYTVFQWPWGINWFQAAFAGDVGTFVVHHVRCPNGRANCNYEDTEQALCVVQLSNQTLLDKTVYTETQIGKIVRQQYAPSTIPGMPGHVALLAANLSTSGKRLTVFQLPDGVQYETVGLPEAFWPSLMRVNPQSALVHLFEVPADDNGKVQLKVLNQQLESVGTGQYPWVVPTAMAVNPGVPAPGPPEVFIAAQTEDQSTVIVRYNESTPHQPMTVVLTPGTNDSSLVIPVVGLLVDADTGDLAVFRQDNDGLDPYNLGITEPLHITTYVTHAGVWTAKATVSIHAMWMYSGSFFHGNYLYVYTTGGQLVRMPKTTSRLTDDDDDSGNTDPTGVERMTITMRQQDPCVHGEAATGGGAQPVLFTAQVFGDIAWLFADESGQIIKVNLNNFCPDTKCWKCETKEKNGNKAWVAGIVVPLVIALGVVGFVGHRRGWWQSLRSRQQYDEIGGGKQTFNTGAIGEGHL